MSLTTAYTIVIQSVARTDKYDTHTRQNMSACQCVMNYLQLSLDSTVNSFVAALSLYRVQTLSIYSFMRYMHPITVMVKVPYEAKERHFPPPIYASRRSTANCYNARGGTRPLTRRGGKPDCTVPHHFTLQPLNTVQYL